MRVILERAREFVEDVKAGLSDDELRRKYNIKPEKFYFFKAAAKDYLAKVEQDLTARRRKINLKHVLVDVRAGMDDDALMVKYQLTARQLQRVLREIINAGLVTAMELSNRLKVTKSQVTEVFVEMGKAVKELD